MWAQMGKFGGAKRIDTPGGHYWLIPESALKGFEVRGRGRPPKPKPATEKRPTSKPVKGGKELRTMIEDKTGDILTESPRR